MVALAKFILDVHTLVSRNHDVGGMTMRQVAILNEVIMAYQNRWPCNVRGIAAALQIDKPPVTRALDTLGQKGFIKRHRNPRDRRDVFVHPTPRALALLSEIMQ